MKKKVVKKINLAKQLEDRLVVSKDLSAVAREILESVRTDSTRTAYRQEWHRFCDWMLANKKVDYPIPTDTLAVYLVWMHSQGYSRATIRRTLTVVKLAHDARTDPTGDREIRAIVTGIMRKDKRPVRKAKPITLGDLTAICEALTANDCARHRRDRALISLGWVAAMRGGELIALDWSDIKEATEGIEIHIRESKTNKTSEPEIVAVPYLRHEYAVICPVRNLSALRVKGISRNKPVFTTNGLADSYRMHERTIERALERACRLAGLQKRFTSHSMRRGFATFAAQRGIDHHALMRHGRWKSAQVAEGYIERARLWLHNPIGELLGQQD